MKMNQIIKECDVQDKAYVINLIITEFKKGNFSDNSDCIIGLQKLVSESFLSECYRNAEYEFLMNRSENLLKRSKKLLSK